MFVTKHRDVIMYIMYTKFSFFCFSYRKHIDYFRFEVSAYFMPRDVLTMQSGHYMTRRLFALKLIVNKVAVN